MAFSAATGGVSHGIYASLNCGPGSGDDPAAVAENRRRVADALAPAAGWSPWPRSTAPSFIPSPRLGTGTAAPEGDGMVTATPGHRARHPHRRLRAGAVRRRARRGVIGAAHAGWKGALGGVLEADARGDGKAGRRARAHRRRHRPLHQPGELRSGRRNSAPASWTPMPPMRASSRPRDRHGHFRFDLEGYVGGTAGRRGIGAMSSRWRPAPIRAESDFFSFRRTTHRGEADYGRQISAIVLTG